MRFTHLILFLSTAISVQVAAQPVQAPTDYPPEALKNGWEGDVIADLTISPRGRVSACRIVQTSGHKDLDDATCSLLIKRSIFKPATDSRGKPVEDHYRTPPIKWRVDH